MINLFYMFPIMLELCFFSSTHYAQKYRGIIGGYHGTMQLFVKAYLCYTMYINNDFTQYNICNSWFLDIGIYIIYVCT